MLDREEIDLAIAELEYKDSSRSNYILLAALYAIRDNMDGPAKPDVGYSFSPPPIESKTVKLTGDSEFLRTVSGKDAEKAWAVMNKLMEDLKAINGNLYNHVLSKLERL